MTNGEADLALLMFRSAVGALLTLSSLEDDGLWTEQRWILLLWSGV